MTTATYSSMRTAPHVVGRDFLFAVEEMLHRILTGHGACDLEVKTELTYRNGAFGKLTTKGSSVHEALIDADGPADQFRMSVFGYQDADGVRNQFLVSMDLTPASTDHLYTAGPASLAHDAHEAMRAAFEAGETLQARDVDDRMRALALKDPTLARRIASAGDQRRRWDTVPLYAAVTAYALLIGALSAAPVPYLPAILCAIALLIGGGYLWSAGTEDRRTARLDRLRSDARNAGLTLPGDGDHGGRALDMSHGGPTGSERLAYEAPTPLEL